MINTKYLTGLVIAFVLLSALALVLAFLSSCAELEVQTGPGTSYPCGINGHLCKNGMCCPLEGDICGGDHPQCPPGMCCFDGDFNGEALGVHMQNKPR